MALPEPSVGVTVVVEVVVVISDSERDIEKSGPQGGD